MFWTDVTEVVLYDTMPLISTIWSTNSLHTIETIRPKERLSMKDNVCLDDLYSGICPDKAYANAGLKQHNMMP